MKPAGRRRKGNAGEREIVTKFLDANIPARRVPLSGAAGGVYAGDVVVGDHRCWRCRYNAGLEQRGYGLEDRPPADHSEDCGCEELIEVKRRGQGFKRIEAWLDDNYAVAFRADRGEWMIALRLEDFIEAMKR